MYAAADYGLMKEVSENILKVCNKTLFKTRAVWSCVATNITLQHKNTVLSGVVIYKHLSDINQAKIQNKNCDHLYCPVQYVHQ